jgi:hypothetical protein
MIKSFRAVNVSIIHNYCEVIKGLGLFNATFNNFSGISWRSVLLVEETGVAGEKH